MVGETGKGGAVSKIFDFFLSPPHMKSGVVQWLGCLAFTQETRVRIPASEGFIKRSAKPASPFADIACYVFLF